MKNLTLIAAFFIYYTIQSQVGIGIPNPDASAVLELASTQKGFLPPRLTTAQRDSITNPAEGLTIFNISKNCLEWYIPSGWYNACGDNEPAIITDFVCTTKEEGIMIVGDPVTAVKQTITATVSVPGSYNITSTNNGVTFRANGNFTTTGNHEILLQATGTPLASGDHNFTLSIGKNSCSFKRTTILIVKGKAGKLWMAYNLGATAPASSSTDAAQYGDYYQWGRGTDGHEKLNSKTTSIKSTTDIPGNDLFITGENIAGHSDWRATPNDNLWQGVNGTNNPCPAGFRIPTIEELNAEFAASEIVDNISAYNSVLKLTASGWRYLNGTYQSKGEIGYFVSSTVDGDRFIFKGFTKTDSSFRGSAFSVRCVKD